MWPDRISNPGSLTYESGALPTVLYGPAKPNVSQLEVILGFLKYTEGYNIEKI